MMQRRGCRRKLLQNDVNGPLYLHMIGSVAGNVSQSVYDDCIHLYDTNIGCCRCALADR